MSKHYARLEIGKCIYPDCDIDAMELGKVLSSGCSNRENDVIETKKKRSFSGFGSPLDRLPAGSVEHKGKQSLSSSPPLSPVTTALVTMYHLL
ncbi:Osteocrin [Manis javanica]|nr:Osteocrin [Manis javanica]